MSIMTVEKLITYMSDIGLTADQHEAAQDVLDGVEGELESYLNRPLGLRSVTEVLLVDDDGYVKPRITPVVSVTAVQGFVTPPTYSKVYGIYIGSMGERSVTYTAGLNIAVDPAKAAIPLAILRVAKREMTTNHDDTLSVKDLRASEPGGASSWRLGEKQGWQPDELKRLSRFRRRVIG